MSLRAPLPIPARGNLTVRAAAGTGKTWLLTSRLLRLLLDGVSPGAILAITFTRKAAAQIYRRVVQRSFVMVGAPDAVLAQELQTLGLAGSAEHLRRARTIFEGLLSAEHELRATTFHAFCQDILHRFPLEAGVPPGFELVESTQELERAAWQALERELGVAADAPLAAALETLLQACGGVEGTRQALEEFLRHRSDWWAYTEGLAEPVAGAQARLVRALARRRQIDDPEDLASLALALARYAELARAGAVHPPQRLAELERARQAPSEEALALAADALITQNGRVRTLRSGRRLRERLGADAADEFFVLHERLGTQAQRLRAQRAREQTARVSTAWYRCGARLLTHYQRLKAEEDLLDFADLEWLTYRLLNRSQHAEWVQYKLDQRIDHLLVDEFQDTNPTQWRLLLPLLQEMAAGANRRPRSVFLVGDEKQSIYRFRRADPGLFNTAQTWLTEHMQAENATQDESWRSSAAIIEFVNLVYDTTHPADGADDFLLADFRPHATRHRERWGRVELLPVIPRGRTTPPTTAPALRDPLTEPRRIEEDQRYHAEGELVARQITQLVGRPIDDDDGVRALGYGDVMILLRDRTHAHAYEVALRKAGIPYAGAGRGTFMQYLEVRDVMHLLRALNAPYDDLALAWALRSPVFACEHEDLLRIMDAAADLPWSRRLATAAQGLTPAHRLARAHRLLERWTERADRIPVHDLLDQIYNEGNVLARYVSAAPPHLRLRVQTSLRRLLELALETDHGRYPSLARFLARVPLLADEERHANAEPDAGAGSCVRLMTIHAAKGLECPVVFLVDAMRDYRRHVASQRALVDWPVDADRPRHLHLVGRESGRDLVSVDILRAQDDAIRREEAHLLYVALTRAKHALYVSGCEPGRGAEHSWYRFLERRICLAAARSAEPIAGLRLPAGTSDERGIVLELGRSPALDVPGQRPGVGAAPSVDPRLASVLALEPATELTYPSRQAGSHKPPEEPGSTLYPEAAVARGVAIHRMLQLLGGGMERGTAYTRVLHEFAHRLAPAVFAASWAEACAVLDEPRLRPYFDPAHYDRAYDELGVLYRHQGADIYGVIDRVVERPDEIVLLDYKTHRHATQANAAALATSYAEQMRLYLEGAVQIWPGRRIRALLLFTVPRVLVPAMETPA